MDEVAPGKRQAGFPAYEGKRLCILRLCFMSGEKPFNTQKTKFRMGKTIDVVQEHTTIQRIEWTRWRTSAVRVENILRTHITADPPRNPKVDGRIEVYTR